METFEAPGPGRWDLDKSHYDGGTTPIMQGLMGAGVEKAYEALFAELGVPARTIRFAWVNGFAYTRVEPLVGAKASGEKAPPEWAIKAVGMAHPEFRRREKAAKRTLEETPWRDAVAEWEHDLSHRYRARNSLFQRIDVKSLDGHELHEYVIAVHRHVGTMYFEHHRLHGYDLGPVGRLAHACRRWDISAAEVVQTLSGASPETAGPVAEVSAIREAISSSGVDPATIPADLDGIRAISADVSAMLDRYLDRHGWVLYTGYDLDAVAMNETPDVLAATIVRGIRRERTVDHEAAIAELRERVPSTDRAEFDLLVADARAAMGMRDAQGPITVEWPTGLLRRALLEGGRRLHAAGHIDDANHILEMSIEEVGEWLVHLAGTSTETGPNRDELARRAELRREQKALDAPRVLGPEVAAPPLDALPSAMAEMVAIVNTTVEELGMGGGSASAEPAGEGLNGLGIGTLSYTGRARVATTAEEALERLEPGEILVTLTTSPAYNLVLSMVGGLVTAEGGPVCHAAVLSRELGLPAVIGVRNALEAIPDGATIEIDPLAGAVRIHGQG